jgi:amino-acid N-acetyltransferase
MIIRPATVRDVPAIASLIETYAARGKMLFRSHAELYETIRDFIVAEESFQTPVSSFQKEAAPTLSPLETGNWKLETPNILGVAALEIVWADLAEVRSLAVAPGNQGRGLGSQLVTAIIDEARRLQIHRIFALTYEQRFFERLGFAVVDKSALPLKVWSGCIKCPKRDGCDEIAVVKTISGVTPVPESPADSHAELRYEVPTPIVQINLPSPPRN